MSDEGLNRERIKTVKKVRNADGVLNVTLVYAETTIARLGINQAADKSWFFVPFCNSGKEITLV